MSSTTSWGLCLVFGLLLPRLAIPQATQGQSVPTDDGYATAWTASFDAAVPVFVTSTPASVVVTGPKTPAVARALDDGEELWTAADARSDVPPAAGEGLTFLAAGRLLDARDAATGARRWSGNLQHAVAGTPAWIQGGLVVPTTGGLEAFRTNGASAWRLPLTGIVSGPVVAQGSIFVGLDTMELVALALADGTERWRATLTGTALAMTAAGDRVFVSADDGAWFAYDQADGDRLWRFDLRVEAVGRPLVGDEHVYLVVLDNTVQAFDRHTGNRRWIAPLEDRPTAGPSLAGEALVLPVADGGVLSVPVSEGTHAPARIFDLPGDLTGAVFESLSVGAVSGQDALVFVLTSSLERPGFRLTALRRTSRP